MPVEGEAHNSLDILGVTLLHFPKPRRLRSWQRRREQRRVSNSQFLEQVELPTVPLPPLLQTKKFPHPSLLED